MPDIAIRELFEKRNRPLLSLEFFPPKDDASWPLLHEVGSALRSIQPDFVTCTYGAGGSTRRRTLEVCELLRNIGYSPVMPHLTCVGHSRLELQQILREWHALGYRNIMALRGDPPRGFSQFRPAPDGFSHASELVELIRMEFPDMCIGVAGYPETHPESVTPEADIRHLKAKVDAGASFITTQLFFENKFYFDFVDRCRHAGIEQPILPGLLPVISLKQVQRMCAMCKTHLPEPLIAELEKAGGEGEAAEEVGIRWVERQIEDLLEHGAPGVHLYILNRSKAALSRELVRFFANR
ncbi:MAG: methylenetetrahydrofolate reductase [NAD(P)H] [Kiritimatiellae bacterium]|nr:methylenetetrahydrofolate reductase [NAD(P)H] [Kiritimatiellia bacterium]MDW8458242.1 methylenetetrahydrofolate reductase [NAD(P)H] [Verrucomicrobiota bacterium]